MTYQEKSRELPVTASVDVLVLGAGPAGVAAAVSAARQGADTLLIEQMGDVGGIATAGLMSHWTGNTQGGIYEEILDRSADLADAADYGFNGSPRQIINPERLKTLLLEMLDESGARFLLYTVAAGPIVKDGRLGGVIIENKSGRQAVLAKVVIDATGDGDIAARAGAAYVKGRETDGSMQPVSVMFKVGGEIITRLLSGENGAIVTDAGMPCISDPGEDLVRLCAENGVEVRVVPGPSAAVSALAVSGLSTDRFVFEGFLQPQKNQKKERLEELKSERRTIIFYEAPHKLCDTLAAMYEVLGDRKITLARELTKIYEEVVRTTLSQAVQLYGQKEPRGEFVLVVEGMQQEEQAVSFEEALRLVQALVDKGQPLSMAAKDVARQTGFKKGELYSSFLT